MKLKFHPAARREYLAAVAYYDGIDTELGKHFVESIEAGFDSIIQHPLAWPSLNSKVRKRVVAVFPYTILYALEEELITVTAVMHQSRKPDYWTSRIPK